MKKSISIVVPAYNEESNIESCIASLKKALGKRIDYEIIVVDDGSTDTTAQRVRKLAAGDKRIKIVSHAQNLGLGKSLRDGIAHAKKEYVTQFHGDNDTSTRALKEMIRKIGQADILSAYTANPQVRSIGRRIVSRAFVWIVNAVFHLKMQYVTGFFVTRTKLLQMLPIASTGFAFYPEAKIRLLKSGATIIEIPSYHTGRTHGTSKAVTVKNILEIMKIIPMLLADIYFGRLEGARIEPTSQPEHTK